MRDPEGSGLDALLRSAAPVRRDAAEAHRRYADVWSRVHASMMAPHTLTQEQVLEIAEQVSYTR
jgi:hypothetical protein